MTRRWPPREELYDLVWSKPAEEVAADLSITGTALTKACAARNIPKPPRGYWTRVRAGQKVKRPPLPKSEKPPKMAKPEPPAFVPPSVAPVVSYPRMVQRTERAYEGAEVDAWGRLVPPWSAPRDILDLMVSREALGRALEVMTLLIGAAREAGMTISARDRSTLLEVGGEEGRLRLKEKVRAQAGLPLRPARGSWDTPSQQKAKGTGELSLLVLGDAGDVAPAVWRDGPKFLEDQMAGIIGAFREMPRRAALRRAAQAVAAERRRQEEEQAQRRRMLEARRQEELRRRREEEQACREALLAQARRWEEGRQLKTYLEWVRDRMQGTPEAESDDVRGWLAWAERELAALDPVGNGELAALVTRVRRMAG